MNSNQNHNPTVNNPSLNTQSEDFVASFLEGLHHGGYFSPTTSRGNLFSEQDSPQDNYLSRVHFLIENGKICVPTSKLGPVKLLTEIKIPKDTCRIIRVMDNSLVANNLMPGDYLVVRQDCENIKVGDILLMTDAENRLFLADCQPSTTLNSQNTKHKERWKEKLKIIPRAPHSACPVEHSYIHSIFVMVLRDNFVVKEIKETSETSLQPEHVHS